MDITVRPSDNKTRIVTLTNVAYVPTFHTNTILFRCFEEAGGYWDTRATPQCLMHGGKPFAITKKQYGQYVVEYNPIASVRSDHAMWVTCGPRAHLLTDSRSCDLSVL